MSIWQTFGASFAASENKFYIYRQYTYIVFILQCTKNRKRTIKLPENSRKKRRSNSFLCWPLPHPRLYCRHFLPSFYINRVPERLYFIQWPYIANKIYSEFNLTAQIEPVQGLSGPYQMSSKSESDMDLIILVERNKILIFFLSVISQF